MLKVSVSKEIGKSTQALIIPAYKEKKNIKLYSSSAVLNEQTEKLFKRGEFDGAPGSSVKLYDIDGYETVVIFAMGKNKDKYPGEESRRNANSMLAQISKYKSADIDLRMIDELATDLNAEPAKLIAATAEGLILGNYKFDKYITKSKEESKKRRLEKVSLITELPKSSSIVNEVKQICESVIYARDLINEPGGVINSEKLADEVKAKGKELGFSVNVFNKKKIEELGMGGLLGVNAGSAYEPRLIIAEHKHEKAKKTLLMVGKGVTFDSGGISLKPGSKMWEMKMDMAGSGAVIGAMTAIAKLKPKLNVVMIVPATDNMPDACAQKPGDILKMYNGKTVEVDNTDAEGRLILADALAYGIETYKPDVTVDLATLTGACVVALGYHAAALLTNNDELAADMLAAGDESFERVWQMPAFDEYDKQIKSNFADVKNVGSGRDAGTITAGKFLERFVDSKPWIHIDIAGTAMLPSARDYSCEAGTGYGVRLLVEYAKRIAK